MAAVLPRSVCLKPYVRGRSGQYVTRFHFSAATKRCEPFVFGGIGGNENNFLDISSCMRKCSHAGTCSRCCFNDFDFLEVPDSSGYGAAPADTKLIALHLITAHSVLNKCPLLRYRISLIEGGRLFEGGRLIKNY